MNQTNAFLEALRLETEGNRAVLEFAQAHKAKYGYTPPLRAIELYLNYPGSKRGGDRAGDSPRLQSKS
jgi:hypothetical protein